ncbi:MAG: hypothetical protein ACRYFK_08720 [Janthinobacterium lividum]
MQSAYLTALVGGLLALAACESRPPAGQNTPVASGVGPAAPPASAPPDTLGAVSAPPLSTNLPRPYFRTKMVAPGLEVRIASVPVPANSSVAPASEGPPLVLTIRRGHQVIFCDTTDDGLAYTEFSEPTTQALYPLWVSAGPGAGQLLVAFNNRPSKDLARRFYVQQGRVTKIDTLLTFDGPAKDVDGDGRREFSGFYDYGEVWDDAQGRRHRVYVPTLYYEIRPTGLVLDSALTKRRAIAQYGAFYGFTYSADPVIIEK